MLEQLREGFHAAAHAKLVELFFHTALRQLGSGSALDPTRPLALAMCAEYATIVESACSVHARACARRRRHAPVSWRRYLRAR